MLPELIERLNRDGERIARHFGLRYQSITAERANVTSRYGSCCEEGTIKVRLCHVVTGKPLKYSSLVNTLCHELAHLRFFNHGDRFKLFYQQMLEWARTESIYQPRPTTQPAAVAMLPEPRAKVDPERTGPVQLGLF
ncbi:MAG: M48 family metallopeptidase [Deltaproteobacteria bacterium]|nr:M48 family metallopeptidase [Deltaproteobacteria bacterium]